MNMSEEKNKKARKRPKVFGERMVTVIEQLVRIKRYSERISSLRMEIGLPADGLCLLSVEQLHSAYREMDQDKFSKISNLANEILDDTEFKKPKIVPEYNTALEQVVAYVINGKVLRDISREVPILAFGFTRSKGSVDIKELRKARPIGEMVVREGYERKFTIDLKEFHYPERDICATLPFSIHFRPGTTREDLLDFIKKNYHFIRKQYELFNEERGLLKNPLTGRRIAVNPNLEVEDYILRHPEEKSSELAKQINKRYNKSYTYKDANTVKYRGRKRRQYDK